jgi:hypothetical protein
MFPNLGKIEEDFKTGKHFAEKPKRETFFSFSAKTKSGKIE